MACVGIDLGTTNSCVAWRDPETGQTQIFANDIGKRTTPSVVSFNDETRFVGQAAVRQQARNPQNTIYESKRFIGKTFAEACEEQTNYPFEIIDLGDGNVNFLVRYQEEDRVFCPEEIAAIILDSMRKTAENAIGQPVTRAVITVPAYFNDAQRQATRDAGRIAGLEVLRIINEPTAAALAYGLDQRRSDQEDDVNVLVFDIGGGTIDTSLLTITGDGVFEVRAISGDTHLGGADFDQSLMGEIARRYASEMGEELDLSNPRTHKRLREACERAKCELSAAQTTEIELNDFFTTISRAQFDDLCAPLYDRCMALVRATLQDAKLSADDVDEVVLVGGTTRIPTLQSRLSAEFGGKELCKSINPDEAVAHGAAIQAAVLNTDDDSNQEHVPDIVLLDVCPLSLGVETSGGLMSVIIGRNTMIPVKKSRIYSTTEDNQTDVTVSVFEGERSETAKNRLLGEFELSGIQEAPRGAPKIRVSFELDADGIFTVTATDESEFRLETGEELSKTLTIQNNKGRLTDEEVKKMVADAEEQHAADAIFRKTIKTRTELENLLYGVRRTFTNEENEALAKHGDEDTIKMALEVVEEQFRWLASEEGGQTKPSNELIEELQRRIDWVENDVARPIVDQINLKVRESSEQHSIPSQDHLLN